MRWLDSLRADSPWTQIAVGALLLLAIGWFFFIVATVFDPDDATE